MKSRVWGVICVLLGLVVALPGVLSAVNSMSRLPPLNDDHIGGTGIVAQVRYYGLRWEILLAVLGLILLLTAVVLFLVPRSRRVPVNATQNDAVSSSSFREVATETIPQAAAFTVACYLHTRLMGTAFVNADGSARQAILKNVAVGDVVVCRSVSHRYAPEAIGVFTVNGRQIGYLDAAFVRIIRERYPNCQIGVYVERVGGGNGLPYTCDVRVAVFRG